MLLPPLEQRMLQAVLPVCAWFGLVLGGGYAISGGIVGAWPYLSPQIQRSRSQ